MEDARGREEEFPWYRYGGMWKVCFFLLFFFLGRKGLGGGRDGLVQRWNDVQMVVMMNVDDNENENENDKWMFFKTTSFLPLLLPLE